MRGIHFHVTTKAGESMSIHKISQRRMDHIIAPDGRSFMLVRRVVSS